MAKILENPDNTSFDIESSIYVFMKDKLSELELAIDGYIKKNLSGFPRPDTISNLFLCSALTLHSSANSILKFVTATFESRNVTVIGK